MHRHLEVVHVITTIEKGGAENAVLILATEQTKHYESVVVVPLKGKPELHSDFVKHGVKVDLSIFNQGFLKQVLIFTVKYRRKTIYHAHLPRSEILLLFTKGFQKFFVTRHNTEPFFPKAPKMISSFLSRLTTRFSLQVIAISNAVKVFLEKENELSRRAECSVVYYGYRREFTESRTKPRPIALPLSRPCRIVSVSRLAEQKNIPLMVKFVHQLSLIGIRVELEIIGDGPQRTQIREHISDLSLSQVKLLGRKSNVLSLLGKYDLFLLTSNYEGFGLVLLEAIDAGLPILAPNNSAIPEVLGYDHPGLYESGDLQSLINQFLNFKENPTMLVDAIKKQSLRLQIFDIPRYINKHLEIYQLYSSSC